MITPTAKAFGSGRLVDIAKITADDINLDDICTSLASINRWNGAHGRFYSVASHSLFVSRLFLELCPQATCGELAAALLHDAHEAYIGDVSAPMKRAMRQYEAGFASPFDEITARVDRAIAACFGLPKLEPTVEGDIKRVDHRAFVMESWALFDCAFDPEWRETIPGGESMTIERVLVVPEADARIILHRAIAGCVLRTTEPAADYWWSAVRRGATA